MEGSEYPEWPWYISIEWPTSGHCQTLYICWCSCSCCFSNSACFLSRVSSCLSLRWSTGYHSPHLQVHSIDNITMLIAILDFFQQVDHPIISYPLRNPAFNHVVWLRTQIAIFDSGTLLLSWLYRRPIIFSSFQISTKTSFKLYKFWIASDSIELDPSISLACQWTGINLFLRHQASKSSSSRRYLQGNSYPTRNEIRVRKRITILNHVISTFILWVPVSCWCSSTGMLSWLTLSQWSRWKVS